MPSVVIADDESDLVKIVSEYFDLEHIDVVGTGHNGKDALELCMKHSPDYLLLDLNMEEYDGFYVLEKLKQSKNSIKIIVITGQIGPRVKQLESYDGLKVFSKPFDISKLVDLIKENTLT